MFNTVLRPISCSTAKLGEMQDQIVGGELARRQPLQVEVGLDLAVELLIAVHAEGVDVQVDVCRLGGDRCLDQ
ncbi:hypothetical protein [Halomonas halodenitrificans]|uniref:hypothetical protein n=1 Tax=Halomonas halodenitrificans TaxID=28252 RepID=UPI00047F7D04|nr:hypothetical protein [Halomonas halodenitrificans]